MESIIDRYDQLRSNLEAAASREASIPLESVRLLPPLPRLRLNLVSVDANRNEAFLDLLLDRHQPLSPSSLAAFIFMISGRTSGLICSLSKSSIQRSGVITG